MDFGVEKMGYSLSIEKIKRILSDTELPSGKNIKEITDKALSVFLATKTTRVKHDRIKETESTTRDIVENKMFSA